MQPDPWGLGDSLSYIAVDQFNSARSQREQRSPLSWLVAPSDSCRTAVASKHGERHNPAAARGGGILRLRGYPLAKALVRTGLVHVGNILREHNVEVALTEDQQVVETLPPDTPEKTLTDRVRLGRMNGYA